MWYLQMLFYFLLSCDKLKQLVVALVMHGAVAMCNIDFEQHGSSDHFWFLHVAILLWIPMRKLYCLRRNEWLGGEAMKEGEEGGTNVITHNYLS